MQPKGVLVFVSSELASRLPVLLRQVADEMERHFEYEDFNGILWSSYEHNDETLEYQPLDNEYGSMGDILEAIKEDNLN